MIFIIIINIILFECPTVKVSVQNDSGGGDPCSRVYNVNTLVTCFSRSVRTHKRLLSTMLAFRVAAEEKYLVCHLQLEQ